MLDHAFATCRGHSDNPAMRDTIKMCSDWAKENQDRISQWYLEYDGNKAWILVLTSRPTIDFEVDGLLSELELRAAGIKNGISLYGISLPDGSVDIEDFMNHWRHGAEE